MKNLEQAPVKSVDQPLGFKTAGGLADLITGPWRDAEICYRYSGSDDKIARIRRVEFHENSSGRLVVVLSVNETASP